MQFLFSRKCLTLLGIGVLIFSVAFWKAYETETQQLSGSTSASAGWWSTSASVTPSFNDDPEFGITGYSFSRLTTRMYNYAEPKGRSASPTWLGKRGKHAWASGEFPDGIPLPSAWDSY